MCREALGAQNMRFSCEVSCIEVHKAVTRPSLHTLHMAPSGVTMVYHRARVGERLGNSDLGMEGWMDDGWMNEWMNEWRDGCMDA